MKTKNTSDLLLEAIREKNNPTVLGLDPKLEYVPQSMKDQLLKDGFSGDRFIEEALFLFNKGLIDATCDIIPAIKPQLAYYEMYGQAGLAALSRTVDYARRVGILVILDGKRNDIGSTSEAYAKAWLGDDGIAKGDFLTVNGYLGTDGMQPFIESGQGLFVLVRTSNPSAAELQDLELKDGRKVYEAMADQVELWNEGLIGEHGFGPVGAVVGATWPGQAKALRTRMPSAFFLVPGYGAQGATAMDACQNFNENGEGAIVNSSRGLMLAYKNQVGMGPDDYKEACRIEAMQMKEALNKAIEDSILTRK